MTSVAETVSSTPKHPYFDFSMWYYPGEIEKPEYPENILRTIDRFRDEDSEKAKLEILKDYEIDCLKYECNQKNLALVSLKDNRTNVTVHQIVPNTKISVASLTCFSGARFSRCPLGTISIFNEIVERHIDSDQRSGAITSYGHASIAEMAIDVLYIEGTPDLYAALMFCQSSVGAGQHSSTRYINFGNAKPVDLSEFVVPIFDESVLPRNKRREFSEVNDKFYEYQKYLIKQFNSWQTKIYDLYASHFEIDLTSKKQVSALEARVLDTVRAFLPKGLFLKTNFCYVTNAREWGGIISFFKSRQDPAVQMLGEQIKFILVPEPEMAKAIGFEPENPAVVKYTQAEEKFGSSLQKVVKFIQKYNLEPALSISMSRNSESLPQCTKVISISAGEKVAIQTILSIYPRANYLAVYIAISELNDLQKRELSSAIFDGYDCYHQMGNTARTGDITYLIMMAHSEMRDFVRHRAWGRYSPNLYAETDYLNSHKSGYILPLYLTEIPEFNTVCQEFAIDIAKAFDMRTEFSNLVANLSWFPQYILPQMDLFCHRIALWFHGSPKEVSYLTDRRRRNGGQINYRLLAWQMAKEASELEPLLSGLLLRSPEPDPTSREEFVDRS
jgi:thymidylate synthase ThyX